MKKMIRLFFAFIILLHTMPVFAQGDAAQIEMADGLRANGLIYVVIGVILIILLGLLLFLWRLDRRIGKLERTSDNKN